MFSCWQGNTAIMLAAKRGDLEVTDALLGAKANVDATKVMFAKDKKRNAKVIAQIKKEKKKKKNDMIKHQCLFLAVWQFWFCSSFSAAAQSFVSVLPHNL